MTFKDLIIRAELNPKNLFLIDGVGAIVSAFLLGVVLVKFEKVFGIPFTVLNFLAIIPMLFVIYGLYAYQKPQKKGLLLKGIAVFNLIYCFLSIGLISYHFNTVTILGWTYIIIEIIVVGFLAIIEFKVGQKI